MNKQFKNFKRNATKVALSVVIAGATMITAHAMDKQATTTANLNMRSGEGTGYRVIETIKEGEKVQVLDNNGSWWKVKHNGKVGYSYKNYLRVLNNKHVIKEVRVKVNDTLRVRTGASTSHKVIGHIHNGDRIQVTGQKGTWYEINYKGSVAYIHSGYCTDTSNGGNHNQSKHVNAKETVKVTASRLMLRSGTSTNHRIIDRLPRGTKLIVTDRLSNGWLKVMVDGRVGYVSGNYTIKVNENNNTSESTNQRVDNIIKVTASSLNVRTGSSVAYSKKGYVHKGQELKAVEKASNGWFKVQLPNGDFGWISGRFAEVVKVNKNTNKPVKSNTKPDETQVNSVVDVKEKYVAQNTLPVIDVKGNYYIKEGSKFDYSMLKATAHDNEDGDLTSNIKYAGNVDTSKVGYYKVELSVTDSKGQTTTEITGVNVDHVNQPPVITLNDVTINQGDKFDYSMLNAKATDLEEGDLTSLIYFGGDVDTSKAGIYKVSAFVSDDNGGVDRQQGHATAIVTVKDVNSAPVLTVNNVSLTQGDKFENSMIGAKATDKQDGDLTSKIVYSGRVDTNTVGTYNLKVTVTDSKGLEVTKTVKVTVNPKMEVLNNAPVINAKDMTFVEGQSFFNRDLNVTAHDKEDGDLTNKVIFEGNVNTMVPGNYPVKLTVTDSKGAITTKTIIATVKADVTNNEPIINAVDTYTMSPGDKFDVEMLGATAHDKEDGDLTYKINLTGDVKNEIGTYKVTLSVTNSKGLTTTKDVTVKVIKRNEAPVINVADTYKLKVGDKFEYSMLNATATDDYDGNLTDRISYQGNVDTTKAGTYRVSVYVADSKDMMGQKFVTVIVEEPVGPNQAPILTVDDLTIEKGSEFNYNMLKYSATDKEDGNLSNKVTFSGNVDTNKLGNYTVTAKVTNSKGETTTKAITVSVKADIANNSPIINAVDTYTMSPGDKFDVEMLGATAHDKEDGDLTYKINLTGNVKDEIGTYKVTLSVTNSKGLTTTKDVTVKVIKRNEAPVINVADTYKLKVGDKFEYSMLNATATDDYDGNLTDRISYQGNVDTTKAGTYRVSVYVADSKDMMGQKFVTVVVE